MFLTLTFQNSARPRGPVYNIIINVSSDTSLSLSLSLFSGCSRLLTENTWLAATLSDSGGGLLLSELRDWPNYTRAKELSVSAITVIAQFTF